MLKITRSRIRALLVFSFVAFLAACGQVSTPNTTTTREEPKATREPERERPARDTSERYDLERDEGRGGHTLKKHVGRTDEQLRERLEEERNISAASTWTDREAAESTVSEALRREHGRIENWMRRGFPRANFALHYDARRVIGRSLRHGDTQAVDCTSVVIVLRADGPDRFFVLTTYPEAPE